MSYISNITVDKINYELKDAEARNSIENLNTEIAKKIDADNLADVAKSGEFSDLNNIPTTLAGYGITDAATSNQGAKADNAIHTIQIGGNIQTKTNGVVNLPAYPTTLPASDVSAWAKAAEKPTYTASEVGALANNITHLSGDVPTSRTVNGKALSNDITLTATDVNALPSSTVIPVITDIYSATSTNGMSGKAVASAISNKADKGDIPSLTGFATEEFVNNAIAALPEPMIFKGSLGTGGTITSLPTASASNEGFTYKVITTGTYASQAAKVGDTFISDGKAWILIPSGDEPSGTVTSVGVSVPTGLSVSNTPITSSGTIAINYANGYSIPTTAKQTEWDDKQNALSTTQLGAVNSGITSTKVSIYDGYSSAISAKYTKPSGGIPASDLASGVIPTSLPASNVTNTYSATGTAPVSGKAVASALSNFIKISGTTLIIG